MHEWDRFRHHAQRVRTLELFGEESNLQDNVYEMLREHYPGHHPLPNLRRLHCEQTYLSYSYTMFTSLTLKEAELFVSNDLDAVSFLYAMAACPSLENLFFYENLISPFSDYNHQAVEKQLCDTILSLSHLKEIQVGRILPAALKHLATLPQLKELEFSLDTSMDILSLFVGSKIIFPALLKLHVATSATPNYVVIAFLDAIRYSKLCSISVSFEGSHQNSGTDMHMSQLSFKKYIDCVTEKISQITTLQKIHIFTGKDEVNSVVLKDLVFDQESLSPLLGLKGVTELNMSSFPVDLAPDAFRQIALAWPALETLHLGEECSSGCTATVNVEDLLPLATSCPSLTELGVFLNGSVSPASLTRRLHTGQSKSNLQTLYLGNSDIANHAHLAVFLFGAFPHARVDEECWSSSGRGSNDNAVKINAMLALFAQVEKLEKSPAMGPLRPAYGKKSQCPYSVYNVRNVVVDPIKL
jgi:hypothetical protein